MNIIAARNTWVLVIDLIGLAVIFGGLYAWRAVRGRWHLPRNCQLW